MAGGEKQKQLAALAPSSGASRHLLPLRRRRVGVLGFPGRRHNRDSRLNPAPTRNSPATVSFRTCRTPTPKPSPQPRPRSEEHTSELQSLMRNSYAVLCLKKKKHKKTK